MKKTIALFFAFALLAAVPAALWAYHDDRSHECPVGAKGDCGREDCDKHGGGCPILGKVIKKSKFILNHETELSLTDEQVQQVKKIKTEAKKSNIMAAAGMKVMMLDMEAKMSQPVFDAEGMKAMIDKNAQGWTDGAKASIDSYAALKKVLSDAQWAKVKELWAEDSDEHKHAQAQ